MSRGVKGLRILIADDHEVFRRGIRCMLEDQPDWKICGEAATGGETIEKTRALRPDLVLLDVAMPDMDAANAILQILSVCPRVKIVALAVHDSGELATKALAAGASGLALKSDAARDLVLTVRNIENNQPFLSPAAVTMIRSRLVAQQTTGPTPANLTAREIEVLQGLARGQSNKALAAALHISVKTVNAHRSNIMRKLQLRSNSELIHFAIRHGFIDV
jgi:DNA-binding NarL/FixJ family response regulator